jgi:RNA polymerase sigma-70 factor (ECF subfamily)
VSWIRALRRLKDDVAVAKNDPERDALDALSRGNADGALTVLMRAYGDALYRYCRQMVGSDDLADEVHQQVFVQAYRALEGFTRRSSFRSWLFAIARHRALDALKLLRRWRRRFLLGPRLPEARDPRPGAEVDLIVLEESRRLERALTRLRPKVRAAVLLRFLEGMTFSEMAEICGEAAGTLQARVARAIPVLRSALEEDVPDDP